MLDQHAIVQKSPFAPKWYDRTFVVIALLIFLWPIGVYALIRNRRMSGFGKFAIFSIITATWLGLLGGSVYGGYYLYTHPEVAHRYLDKVHIADLKFKPVTPDAPPVTDPKTLLDNQNNTVITDNHADTTKTTEIAPNDTTVTVPIPPPVSVPAKDTDLAKTEIKSAVAEAPVEKTTVEKVAVEKPIGLKTESVPPPVKVEPDATPVVVTPPLTDTVTVPPVVADKTPAAENPPVVKTPPAPNAEELEAQAEQLKKRASDLAAAKKNQAAKFEAAISDYTVATNLDPLYQDIEAAFRKDLIDNYKSDHFDEAQFNVYFTPDYVRNYNGQLKRRQTALAQYHKILLDGDTALHNNATKLSAEFETFNQKLADAGKAKIEFPAEVTAQDSKLEALRAKLSSLPEHLISIEELRAKIGSKADAKVAVADTASLPSRIAIEGQPEPRTSQANQSNPPVQTNAADTVDLSRVGPPNTGRTNSGQPPQTTQLPPPANVQTPAAPPAIDASETAGVWVRADGKVTWVLEQGGVMLARGKDKKATKGSWGFDDRTAALSVTHDGVVSSFTVTKDRTQLFMVGGATATSTLRFTKASR